MRKFGWFLVLLALIIGIYGCAKVADTGGVTPSTTVGTLTGTVTKTDGTVISGVTVTVTGVTSSAETNASGWFAISNIPAGANKIVNFSLASYISIQQVTPIEGGRTTHLNTSLVKRADADSVTIATGGIVTSGATTVTIPPVALELADGSGTPTTAEVAVTSPTFTSSADADAFPGEFSGVTTGATVPFESYGWIDMNATGSGPLRIKSGSSVTVNMPNRAGTPDAGVTQIPVWYFDHTSATWKAIVDATGNQTMATYNAATDSFQYSVLGNGGPQAVLGGNPWNVDLPLETLVYIKGKVVDSDGAPVAGVSIRVYTNRNNWRWQTTAGDNTRSDGTFGPIGIPRNRDFYVVAVSGAKRSPAKPFSGKDNPPHNTTSPFDCEDFILDASKLTFTLTWGEHPWDLDSHLTIPNETSESGIRYRLYYGNHTLTPSTAYPFANLDVDDQISFGPENTSVYRLYPGKYRFCIHHFKGDSTIQDSGAQVVLSTDDGSGSYGSYTFTPPASQPVNQLVWKVCDIAVNSSGRITGVTALNAYGSPEASTYNPDGLHDRTSLTGLGALNIKKK